MWKELPLWIFLTVNCITDIKTRKINIIFCILFTLAGGIFYMHSGEKEGLSLMWSLLPGIYLFAFSILTKEAVGIGDGFVVAAIGVWMGVWKTFAILMAAFILTALFGVIKMAKKQASGKTEIAFVPFLTLSYIMFRLGGLL